MGNLNIIIEGQDRVGKDTQITLLKKALYPEYIFQTLHYSKVPFDDHEQNILYSNDLYTGMFNMFLSVNGNFIANRSHIGELVYAPMYRNYAGDYVLDIEDHFKLHTKIWDSLSLITLVNESKYILEREDGESLSESDVDKIDTEQYMFKKAHDKSKIQNKLIIECKDLSIESIHGTIMNFINKVIDNS